MQDKFPGIVREPPLGVCIVRIDFQLRTIERKYFDLTKAVLITSSKVVFVNIFLRFYGIAEKNICNHCCKVLY